VLVFVKDVDRTTGLKKSALERKRKLKLMHEEIQTGFATVRGKTPRTLAATPCRMTEAWALGDPAALASVARKGATPPSKPEKLWGDETNVNSNHPKCVLRRPSCGPDWSSVEWTARSVSQRERNLVQRRTACKVARKQSGKVDHDPRYLPVCSLAERSIGHMRVLALDLALLDSKRTQYLHEPNPESRTSVASSGATITAGRNIFSLTASTS
jgi:hypothetical protein